MVANEEKNGVDDEFVRPICRAKPELLCPADPLLESHCLYLGVGSIIPESGEWVLRTRGVGIKRLILGVCYGVFYVWVRVFLLVIIVQKNGFGIKIVDENVQKVIYFI